MCRSKADGGRRCGAGTADLTPAQAADSIGITRAGLKARLAERAEALARMDEFMAAVNEMDDEHRAAVRGQDPPCACDVCT